MMFRGYSQKPEYRSKTVSSDYGFTENSDDAVDFNEDLSDQKEVLNYLKSTIAPIGGESESSSSQEDRRARSIRKSKKAAAMEKTKENCTEHEEEEVLYWCKEHQIMVCKECLIFGKHRLHTALKGEDMRLAKLAFTLNENAKYLEDEIQKSQDMVNNLICQGEEDLNTTKEAMMKMLDLQHEKAKSALVAVLTNHCSELRTVSEKLRAGMDVEPGLVDTLTSHPLQLHFVPGSTTWQENKLVVMPPLLYATPSRHFTLSSPCRPSLTTSPRSSTKLH